MPSHANPTLVQENLPLLTPAMKTSYDIIILETTRKIQTLDDFSPPIQLRSDKSLFIITYNIQTLHYALIFTMSLVQYKKKNDNPPPGIGISPYPELSFPIPSPQRAHDIILLLYLTLNTSDIVESVPTVFNGFCLWGNTFVNS